MSRGARLTTGVLLLAALALLGFASVRVSERGRFASPYSSLGAGPEGTHALARLAEELGYRTEAFARELSHIGPRGTLVAIGGCRGELVRELSRPEREELTRWVEAGGLLIVAGVPEYVPQAAGLTRRHPATCVDARSESFLDGVFRRATSEPVPDGERVPYTVSVRPVGAPLANMLPFATTRAFTVASEPARSATVLLDSAHGPLALTTELGRGRVVLLGIPDAFTNDALSAGGGVVFARLLEAYAPKGPVRFDEYHLGMGERRSLARYLRDLGYGAPLFQLSLLLVVGLIAAAARLGEARSEPPTPAHDTRRYLAALGSMYARTKDRAGALDVLKSRALTRIGRHYRALNVPHEQLPEWLAAQGLAAVANYTRRIEAHAARPLGRTESLAARARQMDEDAAAAIALGDAK